MFILKKDNVIKINNVGHIYLQIPLKKPTSYLVEAGF